MALPHILWTLNFLAAANLPGRNLVAYVFMFFNLTSWMQALPHAFAHQSSVLSILPFSLAFKRTWLNWRFCQHYWKQLPGICSLLLPFVHSSLQATTPCSLSSSYLHGQPSLLVITSYISFFQDVCPASQNHFKPPSLSEDNPRPLSTHPTVLLERYHAVALFLFISTSYSCTVA